jgi:hypothetical protein
MMFVKKKSRGRIDPVIAATTAMSLALRQVTLRVGDVQSEWI